MFRGMQYRHRRSHRSVTDILTYVMRRPKLSIIPFDRSGLSTTGSEVGTIGMKTP
jgi:hypothetical protein